MLEQEGRITDMKERKQLDEE